MCRVRNDREWERDVAGCRSLTADVHGRPDPSQCQKLPPRPGREGHAAGTPDLRPAANSGSGIG